MGRIVSLLVGPIPWWMFDGVYGKGPGKWSLREVRERVTIRHGAGERQRPQERKREQQALGSEDNLSDPGAA